MKAVAAFLRRLADRLDPPPTTIATEASEAWQQSLAALERHSREISRTSATMSEVSADPHWGNRSRACMNTLQRKGFTVVAKNNGLHLQFYAPGQPSQLVDFWPTTGKWWIAARSKKGAGLQALLRELGVWA